MSDGAAVASQQDTIEALLSRSKRDGVPIRKSFVQQGAGRVRIPGPLAELCRHHDKRGLDGYLLLHAAASAEPWDVRLPAATWARAVGVPATTTSAPAAMSKMFKRLADLQLVERHRVGNLAAVVLLKEDGSGDPYTHPAAASDRYLKVPYSYWRQGWHDRLGLPAKTMLLIALSLDDGFLLPVEKAADWYGISSDTAQRGLQELRQHGLLRVAGRRKPAPLAPKGYTTEHIHTLETPFGPLRRPTASITRLSV